MENLLTTGEVARLLGLSQVRIFQLVQAGRIRPAFITKLGRLFSPDEVARIQRERRQIRRREKQESL
jgi:excisionase family DNA binding protein